MILNPTYRYQSTLCTVHATLPTLCRLAAQQQQQHGSEWHRLKQNSIRQPGTHPTTEPHTSITLYSCWGIAHGTAFCTVQQACNLILESFTYIFLSWQRSVYIHVALDLIMEDYDYDYDYIMAPQRGRPYGANLGSMGRNTGTWSIRSECLSNITSWSRRKGIENTTLPFIPE